MASLGVLTSLWATWKLKELIGENQNSNFTKNFKNKKKYFNESTESCNVFYLVSIDEVAFGLIQLENTGSNLAEVSWTVRQEKINTPLCVIVL